MAIHDDIDRARAYTSGPFAGICSPAELANALQIDDSTIRHAIRSGRLRYGTDYLKVGKQLLISKEGIRSLTGDYSAYSDICTDCYKAIMAADADNQG